MRQLLTLLFLASSLLTWGQNNDPILMTINGQPVLRSEFEYSLNKNKSEQQEDEVKVISDYVPMFVNYKLKVQAAKKAKLDTMAVFKKEFLTYRDMQLLPYMVDEFFIDSVAHHIYDRTKQQLNGKDMLLPAHIFIALPQQASSAQQTQAKLKADSVYNLLKNGANFATLAKQYSQDRGSAMKGGKIGWIGPGMLLQEFETAAYQLKKGEYSVPVLSPVGYHIIMMEDRKPFEDYATVKPEIVTALKKQGIEDASAEYKINKIISASHGRKTREMVLDSVLDAHSSNMKLKYLVQEYHDGLLLYELSKRTVWDPAENNVSLLNETFKKNKSKYVWPTPKFKGFIIHAKNKKDLKLTKKILKKATLATWQKAIKEGINKDSIRVIVAGPYLAKKGENKYVDACCFKGNSVKPKPKYPFLGYCGKVLKRPQSYQDVKSDVLNDLQQSLMTSWVNELRKNAQITINDAVLKTVNKH